jgi:hypothetical protein
MKDIYCPSCECEMTFVNQSLLYSEFYFCEKCDKIYELTVREVKDKELVNLYNSERGKAMKRLAKIVKGRLKVTEKDLITLGYL